MNQMRSIRRHFGSFVRTLGHRGLVALSNFSITFSVAGARKKLENSTRVKILLDAPIFNHAITHQGAWIDTGPTDFVDADGTPIRTGYLASVPIYKTTNASKEYEDVQFLPGIAELHRQGLIELKTSAEIEFEKSYQPPARYRNIHLGNVGLFDDLKIESINGPITADWDISKANIHNAREEFREYLRSAESKYTRYANLVNHLGEKSSQDAWHLHTAERFGCAYFLTMDYTFIRNFAHQKHHASLADIPVKVVTPQELGRILGIYPIAPNILISEDNFIPRRPDLHIAGEK